MYVKEAIQKLQSILTDKGDIEMIFLVPFKDKDNEESIAVVDIKDIITVDFPDSPNIEYATIFGDFSK
jgi:hypothetical protein